jgi:hypothetical protein
MLSLAALQVLAKGVSVALLGVTSNCNVNRLDRILRGS